jgi:tryptophan-rich sensory protein
LSQQPPTPVAAAAGARGNSIWKAVGVATLVALAVAALGGIATEIGPWYRALKKPAFQPPDWLFGPAWAIIYAFTVASAARAWAAVGHLADAPRLRKWIIALFAFNICLNVLWSVLFFSVRRPDLALMEVVFLWGSIAGLIWTMWRVDKIAAWLLVPYQAWVTFASILNIAVVQLNAPFIRT